ncbi:MAG: hypothetical protein WBB65_09260, partial [Anaerolineales bacterium]
IGAGWDVPQATKSSKPNAKPIIFGDNLMWFFKTSLKLLIALETDFRLAGPPNGWRPLHIRFAVYSASPEKREIAVRCSA